MKDIDIRTFVNEYVPSHIKNKIMHYAIKSIYNEQKYLLEHKNITLFNKKYNTKNRISYSYLPFNNDYIQIYREIIKKPLGRNREPHVILNIRKRIKTYISNNQSELYKAIGRFMYLKSKNSSNPSPYVLNNVNNILYENVISLNEHNYGLNRELKHTIYIIYNKNHKKILSKSSQNVYLHVNPLQFLWRIYFDFQGTKLYQLRELATINKIKGRSKLKTRLDYINAFMKL